MYDRGINTGALLESFVTAAKADAGAGGLNTLTGGRIQAGTRRVPDYKNPYLMIFNLPAFRKIAGGIEHIPVQFVATADNTGNTKSKPDITTLGSIIGRVQELFVNHPNNISLTGTKIHQILPENGPQFPLFDAKYPNEHYGWIRLLVIAIYTG